MLEKITEKFVDVFRGISGKSSISEKNVDEAVEQIKMALLEADVNLRVVRRFVNSTLEEAKGEKVLRSVSPGQQFVKIVHDKMVSLLGDENQDLALKGPDTLSVILLLGLQGSGKTTTAAKLAYRLKGKGRKVLLAACDLVRPAAVEQLSVLGVQVGVAVHTEATRDPVQVVNAALARARRESFDTLIVDTAGRLQIDEALMAELARVKEAARPLESLLVADSMTGQAAVDIAKSFDEKIGITGVDTLSLHDALPICNTLQVRFGHQGRSCAFAQIGYRQGYQIHWHFGETRRAGALPPGQNRQPDSGHGGYRLPGRKGPDRLRPEGSRGAGKKAGPGELHPRGLSGSAPKDEKDGIGEIHAGYDPRPGRPGGRR
jgi:Ni2+-binding GTPase involved in maturation of urease and hydrogenase